MPQLIVRLKMKALPLANPMLLWILMLPSLDTWGINYSNGIRTSKREEIVRYVVESDQKIQLGHFSISEEEGSRFWSKKTRLYTHFISLYLYMKIGILSLFRNKRLVLDEKPPQNTSKFAILLEYENPRSFFSFFISCYFIFSLMNALVYVDIDQGIH